MANITDMAITGARASTMPTAPKAYADGFYAGVYTDYSSEELYGLAAGGDETALWTLCRKYEPLFKSEARLYRDRMADAYDAEDFVSIGYILIWDITRKRNFSEDIDGGKSSFGGYLKHAVRWRYSKLFTDYSLKNLVCIGETEDCRGNITRTYAVSEKTESYREQQRERNRRCYDRKITEYVDGFWETSRRRPTNKEIGDYVGISKGMVTHYLSYMGEQGIIDYTGNEIVTRAMRKEMGLATLKVFGSVSCGAPTAEEEAQPEEAEVVKLPRSLVGDGDFYILKANGESMADAGIGDGDHVIIKRQGDAKDGDLAVFRLSDGTSTLKRYGKGEGHGILSPENKKSNAYKTYHERDFEIKGVAVMAIKKL